jgi:hypothetical protein
MRSGVVLVSASATWVDPWNSFRMMSLVDTSALAKTSMARTPESALTVNGPFCVSHAPSVGGSVPLKGVVGSGAACAARAVGAGRVAALESVALSLSTRFSRASTAPLCAST